MCVLVLRASRSPFEGFFQRFDGLSDSLKISVQLIHITSAREVEDAEDPLDRILDQLFEVGLSVLEPVS